MLCSLLHYLSSHHSDEPESSSYPLSVHCNRTGLYKALYMEVENGTSVYSCLFLIEVVEVRSNILQDEFSAYRKFLTVHRALLQLGVLRYPYFLLETRLCIQSSDFKYHKYTLYFPAANQTVSPVPSQPTDSTTMTTLPEGSTQV